MSNPTKPECYRQAIDALVGVCREGQGQIGPQRVRAGVWNPHATAETIPDQHAFNLLLARLSVEERAVLAQVLAQHVELGIFETLKVLENLAIPPFIQGCEGSPYHDFVGRLGDWQWPE